MEDINENKELDIEKQDAILEEQKEEPIQEETFVDKKAQAKEVLIKIGKGILFVLKTLLRWLSRMVWGASKVAAREIEKKEAYFEKRAAEEEAAKEETKQATAEDAAVADEKTNKKHGRQKKHKLTDVEEIVSPGKQYVKAFFSKKLAVAALVIVVLMFLFVFIGPLCMPNYKDEYSATTQKYLPPNMTMLSVPKALNGHIKSISSNSYYTLGVSDSGKLYIWGVTSIGTTKLDIKKNMPKEVSEKKIAYAAAGLDHAVVIAEDGTVYAWGSNSLGQFIASEQDYENQKNDQNIALMPESIRIQGKIDVENIKKIVAGEQFTIILMKDGSVLAWGNKKSYSNADKFLDPSLRLFDIDMTSSAIVGIAQDQKSVYGMKTVKLKYSMFGQAAEQSLLLTGSKLIGMACSRLNFVLISEEDGASGNKVNRLLYWGDFTEENVEAPKLGKGRFFVQVEAGAEHYVGLTNDGWAYAWGDNTHNQLKCALEGTRADEIYAESYQTYILNDHKVTDKSGLKGYLFGTDRYGASVFKRLVNGGRMTLTIGAVAVIISSFIGIVIGILSGYFGGKVDMFLMRVTEVVSAIPFLPFAMILSAILATQNVTENMKIFIIMVILGILSWPGLARLVRGQVLATREAEYVTAAKAMGVNEFRIAFKHILPNVISVIIVTLTLDFAGCMLTESSLSYLGFGVTYPRPTWGNMLNATKNLTIIGNYWWLWLFPSIFLAITTICINIIGDALRDVMDPRTNNQH